MALNDPRPPVTDDIEPPATHTTGCPGATGQHLRPNQWASISGDDHGGKRTVPCGNNPPAFAVYIRRSQLGLCTDSGLNISMVHQ